MRRQHLDRAICSAVVIATLLAGLAVAPAGATHEPWGFSRISEAAGPSDLISPYGLGRESLWRAGQQAAFEDSARACARSAGFAADLLDASGRRVAGPWGLGRPPLVPAGITPGTYSYRLSCTPDGHPVSACASIQILAAPGERERFADERRSLIHDACPTEARARGADDWGYSGLTPASGPAGTRVFHSLATQSGWNRPYDIARDAFEPNQRQHEECGNGATTFYELVDADGAQVARRTLRPDPEGPGLEIVDPFVVPDGTAAGAYFVHHICHVDGVFVSKCASFRVTAPGTPPGAAREIPRMGRLFSDECPRTPEFVARESAIQFSILFADVYRRITSGLPALPRLVPGTTPTTAPTRSPSIGDGSTGGGGTPGGGTGGGGKTDTQSPDVTSVTISPDPPLSCDSSTVTAAVIDDVGVTKVNLEYSYDEKGGAGTISMSPAGKGTWSASLPGGTSNLNVVVVAYDASGKSGDGFGSWGVAPC